MGMRRRRYDETQNQIDVNHPCHVGLDTIRVEVDVICKCSEITYAKFKVWVLY
jgi:hypothetical protein